MTAVTEDAVTGLVLLAVVVLPWAAIAEAYVKVSLVAGWLM